MSFRLLFVCTGNVCRSPMAERFLRAQPATAAADIRVASAGTRALVGYAMDAASAAVLRELGGDSDGHVARQLVPDLVDEADLVLTSDTMNRSEIVRANPLAMHRVFTMREFGRLGAALGPLPAPVTADALRARVRDVAAQRGIAETALPGQDEIGDPFGAPLQVVQRCGEEVRDAVDAIVMALGLDAAAPRSAPAAPPSS